MAKHSVDCSHITAGALALALLPALWPSDAAAHTCDDPFRTDLVTARGIDVGQVTVCNDDTRLTVTYEATFPWCVLKTNLHVARDLAGIPKIRLLGTPNFLRFDIIEDVDCEGEVTFDIPLDEIGDGVTPGEDTVTIAARAVVEGEGPDGTHPGCLLGDKCVAWGEGPRFRPRLPAMYFTYEVQAPPPATACGCDSVPIGGGGSTGADVLESLCPDGALGPGVVFVDDFGFGFGVVAPGAVKVYMVRLDQGPPASCAVSSEEGFHVGPLGGPGDAAACRAHLENRCGLLEP